MTGNFHDYGNCRIAVIQTMKRHKAQRLRTLAYRFHIWMPEGHQYISRKSESLATENEALAAAQQIIDTILTFINRHD